MAGMRSWGPGAWVQSTALPWMSYKALGSAFLSENGEKNAELVGRAVQGTQH